MARPWEKVSMGRRRPDRAPGGAVGGVYLTCYGLWECQFPVPIPRSLQGSLRRFELAVWPKRGVQPPTPVFPGLAGAGLHQVAQFWRNGPCALGDPRSRMPGGPARRRGGVVSVRPSSVRRPWACWGRSPDAQWGRGRQGWSRVRPTGDRVELTGERDRGKRGKGQRDA